MKNFYSSILLLLCFYYTQAQSPKTLQAYYQEALQAYQKKDYASYLQHMQMLDNMRPNHPTILYKLSGGYALQGQKDSSIACLKRLILINANPKIEQDSDFESVQNTTEFQNILKTIHKLRKPTQNSQTVFTLKEKDAHIESIAYDAKTKSFYFGAIHKRKIIRLDAKGQLSDFVGEAQQEIGGVSGMQIDSKNRILWVCTNYLKQMKNYPKDLLEGSYTAVYCYNIDTGKLIQKYELKDNKNKHFWGDLVLDKAGNVYITDSYTPAIYWIPKNQNKVQLFLETNLRSLQGISLSKNEKYLFFSDYASTLYRLELASKTWEPIQNHLDISLKGTDGLYFYKNSLIAIQNGLNPQKIVQIFLDKDLKKLLSYKILENNHAQFNEPTLGLVLGKKLYYIANSQWTGYDENMQIFPEDKLEEVQIFLLKL